MQLTKVTFIGGPMDGIVRGDDCFPERLEILASQWTVADTFGVTVFPQYVYYKLSKGYNEHTYTFENPSISGLMESLNVTENTPPRPPA